MDDIISRLSEIKVTLMMPFKRKRKSLLRLTPGKSFGSRILMLRQRQELPSCGNL